MKKFKLIKKYESPGGVIHIGVIKSVSEWQEYFPTLEDEDFEIKNDWFEVILPSHEERYNMCKDQIAQIDCRKETCFHYDQGHCLNISPAITLNYDNKFTCWSFNEIDEYEEDYDDEDLNLDDEDEESSQSLRISKMRTKWNNDSKNITVEDLPF